MYSVGQIAIGEEEDVDEDDMGVEVCEKVVAGDEMELSEMALVEVR